MSFVSLILASHFGGASSFSQHSQHRATATVTVTRLDHWHHHHHHRRHPLAKLTRGRSPAPVRGGGASIAWGSLKPVDGAGDGSDGLIQVGEASGGDVVSLAGCTVEDSSNSRMYITADTQGVMVGDREISAGGNEPSHMATWPPSHARGPPPHARGPPPHARGPPTHGHRHMPEDHRHMATDTCHMPAAPAAADGDAIPTAAAAAADAAARCRHPYPPPPPPPPSPPPPPPPVRYLLSDGTRITTTITHTPSEVPSERWHQDNDERRCPV